MKETRVSLRPKGSTRLRFWEKGEMRTPDRAPGCGTESTDCNTEQKPEQEAVAHWTEKTEIMAKKSQSTYRVLRRVGGKRMRAGGQQEFHWPKRCLAEQCSAGTWENCSRTKRNPQKGAALLPRDEKQFCPQPTTDLSPGILIVTMVMAKWEPT